MTLKIATSSYFFSKSLPHALAGTIRIGSKTLNITPITKDDKDSILSFFDSSSTSEWVKISTSIDQSILRHFENPWSCYVVREAKKLIGVMYLEPDSYGNLLFTPVLFSNEKIEPYALGTWRWVAEQLLPTMHARQVEVPLLNREKDTHSLEQTTIRIAMAEDLRPALRTLQAEGFEQTTSNIYAIFAGKILNQSFSESEEAPLLPSENEDKKRCTLI